MTLHTQPYAVSLEKSLGQIRSVLQKRQYSEPENLRIQLQLRVRYM